MKKFYDLLKSYTFLILTFLLFSILIYLYFNELLNFFDICNIETGTNINSINNLNMKEKDNNLLQTNNLNIKKNKL